MASSAFAALGAGTLSLLGAAGASAADVELVRDFDYTCAVTAGGLGLGNHIVGVKSSTMVPESVTAGEVISSRPVNITLTRPELLRNSTVAMLGGVAASGVSTDSAVTLTTGGQTTSVAIPELGSPQTPIPQTAGEPWLIPASGNVPDITTPDYAVDSVVLGMPAAFNIAALIYKADGSTINSTLNCTGPADLALGSIAVVEPEPEPEPEPQPTIKVPFNLKGSTTIKAGNGSAALDGKIAADFNLATGSFLADLTLNKTKAKLKALGFLPVDADLAFTTHGKTSGQLKNNTLTAHSKVGIQITAIKAFGLKLGGGSKCQTSSPSDITLTSAAGKFDPLKGGSVSGVYTIAKLQGCGALNDILSLFAAGHGNKITASLSGS